MGVVDTIRFINQFTTGYGDYTKEPEKLFGDLSLKRMQGTNNFTYVLILSIVENYHYILL